MGGKPLFFVTFNIIITFPKNFAQIFWKVSRFSSASLTVFIVFLDFLNASKPMKSTYNSILPLLYLYSTLPLLYSTSTLTSITSTSTLIRLFSNCIRLYWYWINFLEIWMTAGGSQFSFIKVKKFKVNDKDKDKITELKSVMIDI